MSKSYRVDEFRNARRRRRAWSPDPAGSSLSQPFLNRWVIDQSHALMSFWDFVCGRAPPEIPASGRKHQHCKRRWFRDSGSHIGTDIAASRLSEVRSPHVVIALHKGCAESLAPHDEI